MAYLPWIIFVMAAAMIVLLMAPWRRRAAASGHASGSRAPASQRAGVVLPSGVAQGLPRTGEKAKVTLRERLVHAGLYQESFLFLLQVIRLVSLGMIVFGGYLLSAFGLVSLGWGLFIGVLGGAFATIAPSFFLDYLKGRRQLAMQRALPDALDVIVVSLEGGLPVSASFQRVSSELADVHPLLAAELTIVQREMQMGRSLGEAMSNMAGRFDLDDLRAMASVIRQSERYGAGVTRAFRIFADGLRESRSQRAEEMARKAAVKLVFPTVIFIFPAMFVVILAPTVFRLLEVLRAFNADLVRP